MTPCDHASLKKLKLQNIIKYHLTEWNSNERESILYVKIDLQSLEKVELLKQNKTKQNCCPMGEAMKEKEKTG